MACDKLFERADFNAATKGEIQEGELCVSHQLIDSRTPATKVLCGFFDSKQTLFVVHITISGYCRPLLYYLDKIAGI
jgi:hypothetical protein